MEWLLIAVAVIVAGWWFLRREKAVPPVEEKEVLATTDVSQSKVVQAAAAPAPTVTPTPAPIPAPEIPAKPPSVAPAPEEPVVIIPGAASVYGRVLEYWTGKPISGVQVAVSRSPVGEPHAGVTRTDEHGTFLIAGIKPYKSFPESGWYMVYDKRPLYGLEDQAVGLKRGRQRFDTVLYPAPEPGEE